MNEPPGTVPATNTHPRRPPAHKSVSLRHSPPNNRPSSQQSFYQTAASVSPPDGPASDKANPPSTVSPRLVANKHSSGESSDAGKWFESTNNNAVQSNASFVDNTDDPPFFLRNSSSSGTPPEGIETRQYPHSVSVPHRPGLLRLDTDGSSTEDFRSVIDDLTVMNKRLKQKLRKYEKMYDTHLQDEKLFEVKFHGLPDHKKRELEETLQKFAASLDDGSRSEYPTSYAPPLHAQKTASSTSRFAESGYASISASGQNSTNARSGADSDRRTMSRSQFNQQQENVHSYLHDIPAGLMPKHNAPMTDKAKKKLVVRRLEQVFAGKRSAPGAHAQPMQQEEVAQSAATADRRAKEESGQPFKCEGHREARIMPVRSEDDDVVPGASTEVLQKLRPHLAVNEQDFASGSGSGSPDQRPTRPLDLDPYRAQVSVENMEYIRHLGFTPPDVHSGDAPQGGHGWLYLNLLINMAQLHTINVTPDFVKDAVSEYSSMLELSHDGRKIRWKGGHDITKDSSGSSSEHLSGASPYDGTSNSISPTKRIKTGHSGGSSESLGPEKQARRAARAIKEKEQNKYTYTPIFYHKEDSDEDDDYYNLDMLSSSNSMQPAHQPGDSSGFSSSAIRSSTSRKKRDEGPMIFYNRAKFCTDLSGDRNGSSIANPSVYSSITSQPLGTTLQHIPSPEAATNTRQPGNLLDTEITSMEIDTRGGDRTTSSEGDMDFSPDALRNDTSDDSPETIDFEASGLGGVQPDDNFAIKVKRSTTRTERSAQAIASRKYKQSQFYPKKILEALREQTSSEDEASSKPTMIREEILSSSRKDLPSSELPPASFLPFDSTSSGDVDSDLESDVSSGPSLASSSERGPTTALQMLNISPIHLPSFQSGAGNSENRDAGEPDSDSDGSVDLLATARQLDPNAVRISEREYEAALAERLAEEIPAGSSAATAGGGSGFNTPLSAIVNDDAGVMRSSSGSASTRATNLKRTRTSDSITTALKQKSGKSQKREH